MVSDNIFHVFHFKKKQVSMAKKYQSHSADQPTTYVKHLNPEAGKFVAP